MLIREMTYGGAKVDPLLLYSFYKNAAIQQHHLNLYRHLLKQAQLGSFLRILGPRAQRLVGGIISRISPRVGRIPKLVRRTYQEIPGFSGLARGTYRGVRALWGFTRRAGGFEEAPGLIGTGFRLFRKGVRGRTVGEEPRTWGEVYRTIRRFGGYENIQRGLTTPAGRALAAELPLGAQTFREIAARRSLAPLEEFEFSGPGSVREIAEFAQRMRSEVLQSLYNIPGGRQRLLTSIGRFVQQRPYGAAALIGATGLAGGMIRGPRITISHTGREINRILPMAVPSIGVPGYGIYPGYTF